jgi:hypothetical protein
MDKMHTTIQKSVIVHFVSATPSMLLDIAPEPQSVKKVLTDLRSTSSETSDPKVVDWS